MHLSFFKIGKLSVFRRGSLTQLSGAECIVFYSIGSRLQATEARGAVTGKTDKTTVLPSFCELNVSKFQNEFMMSSFLPKNKQNFIRISALAFKKCSNQKILLYNYVKQSPISYIKCLFFCLTSFQSLVQKSLKNFVRFFLAETMTS